MFRLWRIWAGMLTDSQSHGPESYPVRHNEIYNNININIVILIIIYMNSHLGLIDQLEC